MLWILSKGIPFAGARTGRRAVLNRARFLYTGLLIKLCVTKPPPLRIKTPNPYTTLCIPLRMSHILSDSRKRVVSEMPDTVTQQIILKIGTREVFFSYGD